MTLAARRRWRAAGSLSLVAACFLFLKGDTCAKEHITDPDVPVDHLDISSDTLRLAPGASVGVSVDPYDASDRLLDDRPITWVSGNAGVATVASTVRYQAMVTAGTAGTTTVTATVGGVSAHTTVIVATPTIPVARVTLLIPSISARPLDTAITSATAHDASDRLLDGRAFAWTVADPTVAAVVPAEDGVARFVGLKVGTSAFTVTSEGKSATGTITVSGAPAPAILRSSVDTLRIDVGATASITIGGYDRAGGALPDSVVKVSIADAAIAQFSPAGTATTTGRSALRVTGLAVGTTKLRAATLSGSLDVPVIVAQPKAARVTIAPKTATVVVNHTATFTATAADASGAAYRGTIAFRAVGAGTSITPAGVLTATQAGNVLVIASADALADTAQVTVAAIDSVRIAPRPTLALTTGGSASAVARVYAADKVVGDAPVTWTTSSATIADIVPSNDVVVIGGKSAGTALVVATSGGKADTVAVTVTAAPTNTATIHPLGIQSMKRLAGGSIETFNGIFIAGDHEANGDKSIQAIASYLFTGLPTGAAIDKATLTIALDAAESTGNPFGLGSLMVERASGSTLNEGTLSTSAIVLATSMTPATVTVDVTPLVRSAYLAGQPSIVLRFRFATLLGNDAQIDYVQFTADPLTVSYSVPGVRASRAP